ncbi:MULTISPECIES: DUF3095 family protein [unclassified Pedobacter]
MLNKVCKHEGDPVHFVDGADGGYTQAIRILKQKICGCTINLII